MLNDRFQFTLKSIHEFVLIYYYEKIWHRYELSFYEILEIDKDDKHCKNTQNNSYKSYDDIVYGKIFK